jgi:four helix bundle protein
VNDLKPRTKRFALDVILYSRKLPRSDEFTIIKRQLIRSATSTASNYRAAQRAKSKADFISKLGTTEEEADESLFWLECLTELATRPHVELNRLLKEADELSPSSLQPANEPANNDSTTRPSPFTLRPSKYALVPDIHSNFKRNSGGCRNRFT